LTQSSLGRFRFFVRAGYLGIVQNCTVLEIMVPDLGMGRTLLQEILLPNFHPFGVMMQIGNDLRHRRN
jgi:hypothetical protein